MGFGENLKGCGTHARSGLGLISDAKEFGALVQRAVMSAGVMIDVAWQHCCLFRYK